MQLSGIAALVAGACSMACGESAVDRQHACHCYIFSPGTAHCCEILIAASNSYQQLTLLCLASAQQCGVPYVLTDILQ
jgi:hypothetical protein